ncbi:MAG: hypothetical protein ACFFCS_22505 [Candidatus Hodarchaeota archaeon]
MNITSPACRIRGVGDNGHPPRQHITTADNLTIGMVPERLQDPSPRSFKE